MRPRPDRGDHFLWLCGREDKLEMRRRLFNELEQRVETRAGHHVGLVDDVDLVPGRDWRVKRAFPQVTGIVNAAVRRRVDLDHVDAAWTGRRESQARRAL